MWLAAKVGWPRQPLERPGDRIEVAASLKTSVPGQTTASLWDMPTLGAVSGGKHGNG